MPEALVKRCSKCGVEYPATTEHFHRSKAEKGGLCHWCKSCVSKSQHRWYEANRKKVLEQSGNYQKANREMVNARQRKRYAENPEKRAGYQRKYRAKHPEKVAETQRCYGATHLEEKRERRRMYGKEPRYRLNDALSSGIYKSLGDGKNGRHWESLVGYTVTDLMAHLESQFSLGMTWDNYGNWHIDHIKPVSHFNFESPDDLGFKECWSLWNLQPLWEPENIRKSNKCDSPPLPLLHGKV